MTQIQNVTFDIGSLTRSRGNAAQLPAVVQQPGQVRVSEQVTTLRNQLTALQSELFAQEQRVRGSGEGERAAFQRDAIETKNRISSLVAMVREQQPQGFFVDISV